MSDSVMVLLFVALGFVLGAAVGVTATKTPPGPSDAQALIVAEQSKALTHCVSYRIDPVVCATALQVIRDGVLHGE